MKKINFFTSLKSLKKGGESRVESGSINQRYGSEDPYPDQDSHQNVMDPQHCFLVKVSEHKLEFARTRVFVWFSNLIFPVLQNAIHESTRIFLFPGFF